MSRMPGFGCGPAAAKRSSRRAGAGRSWRALLHDAGRRCAPPRPSEDAAAPAPAAAGRARSRRRGSVSAGRALSVGRARRRRAAPCRSGDGEHARPRRAGSASQHARPARRRRRPRRRRLRASSDASPAVRRQLAHVERAAAGRPVRDRRAPARALPASSAWERSPSSRHGHRLAAARLADPAVRRRRAAVEAEEHRRPGRPGRRGCRTAAVLALASENGLAPGAGGEGQVVALDRNARRAPRPSR